MGKTKIYKMLCLTVGLGIALSSAAAQGASITKTLKAVYNNIAISYNGEAKKLSIKPFTVNGTTYVPLRAIGEIMGADVKWANNTIYINAQTASATSFEQQISDKNFENASLKQQLEIAKKDLEAFTGTGSDGKNLSTEAIGKTLDKIKSTYKNTYDVEWGFGLQVVAGRLELIVSYDSRYEEADFDKIIAEERKQFIKGICADIIAAHKDIEIFGVIKNSSDDMERSAYRYTKTGSYEYKETTNFSLDDFEKELGKTYMVINCIGFSIPINDIELVEKNNEITFTLTTALRPSGTTDDFREKWNNLNSSDKKELESFLKKIKDDIEHQDSSYTKITGAIRDTSTGSSLATYDEDGKAYINSLNIN